MILRFRSILCIGLGLLWVVLVNAPLHAKAIDIDNPPKGVFTDEWYVIMMDGKKSGHSHSTMERAESDGRDVIRTKTDLTLEIRRNGKIIKISNAKRSDETLQGEPLSFSDGTQMGKAPGFLDIKGVIKEGKVTVTSKQFTTVSNTKTYAYPVGAMLPWGMYREQMQRGFKSGTSYDLLVYEPTLSMRRATNVKVTIKDRAMLDIFGRKVEAVEATLSMSLRDTDMETTTWMTDDGEAVQVDLKVMDIPIKMIASTKAVALSPNDPTEFMVQTFVKPSEPIKAKTKRIAYRLRMSKDAKLPDLPETTIQRVQADPDNNSAVKITVETTKSALSRVEKSTLPDDQRARCLEASSMMNYEDPPVAKLAARAKKEATDANDAAKLAQSLTEFVSVYVKTKNLGVGFASASEVARSREGDCSEHGVLLATLGRANGIPSRVVTGLVYADQFAGGKEIFAGHLWTQFWIDGRWVDFDATRPDEGVGPTHIALCLSEGGDSTLGDLVSSIWLNLSQLEIDVLNQE